MREKYYRCNVIAFFAPSNCWIYKHLIYLCPMKFFAFIMAIIVLVLSCMPCTDTFAMTTRKAKTEITKSPASHNQPSDACSPFCQCACCAGFSVYHSLNRFAIIEVMVINQHYSSYLPSEIIEVSLPVWQPPQL